MGPVRERIAAVFANGRQGSGYLLSARVVLTAAHVVGRHEIVEVSVPGRAGRVPAGVVWARMGTECDAALLLMDEGTPAGELEPVVWGEVTSLDPLPGCQVIGFPYVRRGPDGTLESEQLIGTVKPGSSLIGNRLVLDSDHTPPAARRDGGSPWAGLSGAALFRGDALIGVVAVDPQGWQHGRVEATPAMSIIKNPSFRQAFVQRVNMPLPATVAVSGSRTDPDTKFEADYAHYIDRKHRSLTIFGLDLRDRSAANWPLDAAYLSLEASSPLVASPHGDALARGTLPADQALAGQHRVMLRGVAGSGKTTLVQWLAVSAARRDPPDALGHLRGKVPFVLPLRTLVRRGELPASPDGFLRAVGSVLADAQPDGWARRVLAEGRGLVMVDGMDEVSERERDRVRDWLRELLLVYPRNLWLVTSRPSAVEDAWLGDEGFTELTLSPMSRDDIASFVTRWHDAARATCSDPDETERLASYEESLLTAIRTKQDLGRLATNPLMCGMICALHRDRRGYLPHGRKELYDAALAMLTADRDQRRDIGGPDGIELTAEPQIQLLQRLAYWLIRNGRSELDRDHAERIIADALPSVPAAASQGDAHAIFRHLLLRSGVIREPTGGTVDFVHRTFQDYLGAKRAVEEWDIGLLVDKAADAQWEDVIRMAVAHARPRERAEILRALIDRPGENDAELARVSLLAMACLEHATELDPAVRDAVQELASSFIPPRYLDEAKKLADIGPLVLELLPGPEGCPDDDTAHATVVTASLIATDAAIPVLKRFREHPSLSVRSQLAWNWQRFHDKRYFDEVISRLLPDDLRYVATSETQLRLLRDAGGRSRMQLIGRLKTDLLREYLDPRQLTDLTLSVNGALSDLEVLKRFPKLTWLHLDECPALDNFSALYDLPLTSLAFRPSPLGESALNLSALPPSLKALTIEGIGLGTLPIGAAPRVKYLLIRNIPDEGIPLAWMPIVFPCLEDLHLHYPPATAPIDISPLAALIGLRVLNVYGAGVIRTSAVRANGVEITSD